MKETETNQQESRPLAVSEGQQDQRLEADWGGVIYPASPGATFDQWHPTFWDALVGYWGYIDPDRLRDFETETRLRRSSDDEDFSSEHGYQPEFEGRSEFEHGDFERWL